MVSVRIVRRRLMLILALLFLCSAGLVPYASHVRAQSQDCYTTQNNICSTTCFSTGNWWQCLPLVPTGYTTGICNAGNVYCYQGGGNNNCTEKAGCQGQSPPDWGSCANGGSSTYCYMSILPSGG
jgi:putative hemolysin